MVGCSRKNSQDGHSCPSCCPKSVADWYALSPRNGQRTNSHSCGTGKSARPTLMGLPSHIPPILSTSRMPLCLRHLPGREPVLFRLDVSATMPRQLSGGLPIVAKQGRRWAILLTGVLLGSAGMWCVATYHLVQTADGTLCIPRVQAGLSHIYVDVRTWTAAEWREHPQLAQALMRAGRQDVLPAAPLPRSGPWWGRPPLTPGRPVRPLAQQPERVNR